MAQKLKNIVFIKVPTVIILALCFFCFFSWNIYSQPLLAATGQSGVVIYNKAKAFDGYNFYQNNKGYAYLMDMWGRLVYRWEFSNSKEGWGYARLFDNGDIIKICKDQFLAKFDKYSRLIWEIPIAANHDIELLPDGTFLVPVKDLPVKYNNRMVMFDSIVHISSDGKKLGSWSTYKHLKELRKFHPPLPILDDDYYHLNSIQTLPGTALGLKNKDFQKGNWLICLRNADLIVILDKDTHKVVWSWGPGELDMPHMPRMLNNGNILVYDNGMHRSYTRLVIVNPVSRKIVWEYKASQPQNFHSTIEGSGQLLGNGNFLICDSENGRAFEITSRGKIVWEFLNPERVTNGNRSSIYRMLRIPKKEVLNWLGKEKSHSYPFLQAPPSDGWMPFIARSRENGYNQKPLLKNVVIYDKNKSFPGYNLFISSHASEVSLMDMNGRTIHQWHSPSASLPVDHHTFQDLWARARILGNGDLLASTPAGGMLKIDQKSALIWSKKINCHGDFDIDSNGNIYILTKPNKNTAIAIDSITILSPNGEIKKEISLYDLFKKSYYSNGTYINLNNDDAYHANSVQVLDGKSASKIPAFKKGNVLVTMNNLGVIICVDPDKEKIVWSMGKLSWEQGQHFAKLLDNGDILVFDNLHRYNLSRVVEFDPADGKIVWKYSGQNGRFFSYYLGQCYRLPNGNTLINESLRGHSFEVTPDKKIVWEFYNPNRTGKYDELIAINYQMERIDLNMVNTWLKN